jgi:hypothetical protein
MTHSNQLPFQIIDDYSRQNHQCFVAEMFLNEDQTRYILCFRPATVWKTSANQYACRYVYLVTSEVRKLEQTRELSDSIKVLLDKELANLD